MKRIVLAMLCIACSIGIASAEQPASFNSFEGEYSQPYIQDGIIYITTPTKIFTLNATDGFKLWTAGTGVDSYGTPFGNIISMPTIDDGICYYTTDKGWCFHRNVTTGNVLCILEATTFSIQKIVHNTPITVEGITYTVADNGTVSAFNGTETIWSQSLKNPKYTNGYDCFRVDYGETIHDKQATAKATPIPREEPRETAPTNTTTSTSSSAAINETENMEICNEAPLQVVQGDMSLTESNATMIIVAVFVVAIAMLSTTIVVKRKLCKK
jgi:hypothetical protein